MSNGPDHKTRPPTPEGGFLAVVLASALVPPSGCETSALSCSGTTHLSCSPIASPVAPMRPRAKLFESNHASRPVVPSDMRFSSTNNTKQSFVTLDTNQCLGTDTLSSHTYQPITNGLAFPNPRCIDVCLARHHQQRTVSSSTTNGTHKLSSHRHRVQLWPVRTRPRGNSFRRLLDRAHIVCRLQEQL